MDVPPWFHLAIEQALAPVNERLDRVEVTLDRLEVAFDRFEVALAKTARISAVNHNLNAASSIVRPYEVVMFRDESDPTSEQHGLPPLVNANAVTALNEEQTIKYYRGYYAGDLPSAIAHRKNKIMIAIGCTITTSI